MARIAVQPSLVSVVICTHNRVSRLRVALHSACNQDFDSSRYEVLVVDNNSTDGTRAMVEECSRLYPNVRYCQEPRQGVSNTRNRGWQDARGEYVGYLDDDGKAPPNWLKVASEIIRDQAPGVFGGPYLAYYDSQRVRWYKDEYGSHEQGGHARPLGPSEFLDGTNLFIRRTLLESLGGFDPELGMMGETIAYGEEPEIQIRIRATRPNEQIVYFPQLIVYHLVPAHKMAWRWLLRQHFASGRYTYRLMPRSLRAPAWLVRFLYHSAMIPVRAGPGAILRDRRRYPYPENFLYERVLPHVHELGALVEQAKYPGMSRRKEE